MLSYVAKSTSSGGGSILDQMQVWLDADILDLLASAKLRVEPNACFRLVFRGKRKSNPSVPR